MRIIIDNISPGTSTSKEGKGGMRLYLENLLSGMIEVAPQHEYVLATPSWNKDFNLPKNPNLKITELPSVPKSRLRRVLYEQMVYPFWVNQSGGDVFLGLCNSLPFLLKIPSVVVIQSTQFQFVPESYGFLQRNYLRFGVRGAVRKANAVITVSEHSKHDIVRWAKISGDKVHPVHHGAGLTAPSAQASSGEVRNLREKYGPFILCVSSFYPYKNLSRLIDAFALLKADPAFQHNLVIVGDDTARVTAADLSAYAASLGIGGSVKFTGRVDHAAIAVFYRAADVLVMPSLYETFGHPLLEAMAADCAVVTSQASCMPEIVGDAAELADPYAATSIAAALAKVLTQPARREELVRRGRERIKQFSWKTAAQKTLAALEYATRDI